MSKWPDLARRTHSPPMDEIIPNDKMNKWFLVSIWGSGKVQNENNNLQLSVHSLHQTNYEFGRSVKIMWSPINQCWWTDGSIAIDSGTQKQFNFSTAERAENNLISSHAASYSILWIECLQFINSRLRKCTRGGRGVRCDCWVRKWIKNGL